MSLTSIRVLQRADNVTRFGSQSEYPDSNLYVKPSKILPSTI